MSFGPDHYVPVLKVKRGEKTALQCIDPAFQARIIPLLEIVERRPDKKPTVSAHLDTAFSELADSLLAYSRCFLDVREIAVDGPAAADEVFRRATNAGINFTPVTGLSRTADLEGALNHAADGLAIRLTREEFEEGGLATRLTGFMSRHGLRREMVDLIVDLGPVDELIADGIAAFALDFLSEVPNQLQWKTLTVSGSAFPLSMRVVERRSHAFIERADWVAWRDHLYARGGAIPRIPTYSDCGIQHPAGVEGFDPVRMQVSASVRYTLPDYWLLIKGESTRRILPSEQFPQLAKQLVYGHLRSHYAGENHCQGCSSIKAAADERGRFGSAEAWRRLGTIHHITTVMQGLASRLGS